MILVDSVSAYGAAVIAGVAAVIGGLLAAGSNLLVEWQRGGRADKEQAERDQRELRQATRLVLAELSEASTAIRHAAKSHLTWPQNRQLPAFAWREYRVVLAAHLPIAAWRWVQMAYDNTNALNWRVIEMGQEFNTTGPVHFIENEWLRRPFETVHQAMSELEVALGETRGIYGYSGYVTVEDRRRDLEAATSR